MTFQLKTEAWLRECFPDTESTPMLERVDRFMEEVLELAQSLGYPLERVIRLGETHVYERPVGDPEQEVGGVMLTLAALCGTVGLDMQALGDAELARVSTPERMAKLRRKNAGWNPDSPLPGGLHEVK